MFGYAHGCGLVQMQWSSPILRSGAGGDVLEAHLAGSHEPTFSISDPNLPKLLRAALLNWSSIDHHAPGRHRPQEVRVVVDAHGDEILIRDRERSANARCALDRGRIDAAVYETPRLMMIGTEIDPTRNVGRRRVVELESGRLHERGGRSSEIRDQGHAHTIGTDGGPGFLLTALLRRDCGGT